MAFRILKKVKDGGSTLNSLYQFVPTTIDGVSYYLEFNSKEEVDEYVEEQLNLGIPKTSLEVVAPMKYTVSASIEEEECGCGVPSTNPTPAEVPYTILANPVGGVVQKGNRITYIIDADSNKFQKLIMDNAEVDSNYYTVTAGSTIIALASIYADTLAIGQHTVKFIFTDGNATDTFEIVDEQSGSSSDDSTSEDGENGEEENTTPNPDENNNQEDQSSTTPPSNDENDNEEENEESGNPSDSSSENTDGGTTSEDNEENSTDGTVDNSSEDTTSSTETP